MENTKWKTFNKILGYFLIFIGSTIIFWTLYSSYNIFNEKKALPEIFEITRKETKILLKEQKEKPQSIQFQIKKILSEQLREILPAETFPKILNLLSWSILAGILIFGGGKIAGLGIQLVVH